MYHNPTGGVLSSIDKGANVGGKTSAGQFNTQKWHRKALVERARQRHFGNHASVMDMPKHYGKAIVKYHYLPVIHPENINDQGIDAAGAVFVDGTKWVPVDANGKRLNAPTTYTNRDAALASSDDA